jgi:Tat protein translocase TatB subunit
MFGTLGAQEILLILILGLIVFGPRKLPEIGKTMGKMLAEFRKASNDFRQTVENEVEADKLRAELAEQAARTQAPAAPVEAVTDTTGEAAPAATEPPAAGGAEPQTADGQAPAAPEGHASADATPDPAVLHPPAESVSRE